MKRFLTLFMLACLVFGAASTATADARPSYQNGFARSASESARPQDWNGLVGLWLPSLGPSGLTLRDWSGRGHHGSLTSMDAATDWVVDGERGYVLDFDGTDDHLVISSLTTHTYSNFTIMGWYKSTNTTVSDDEYLWAHTVGIGSVNRLFFGLTDDASHTDQVRLLLGDPTDVTYYGTSDVADQTWHHIAGVRTSTRVKIYVDGVEESDTADTIAGTAVVIAAAAGGPWIGDFPGQTEQIDGQVENIRLYDIALPSSQITEIYRDPLGIVRLDEPQAFASIQAVAASPTSQIIIISWLGGFGALTMLGFIRRKKPNAR